MENANEMQIYVWKTKETQTIFKEKEINFDSYATCLNRMD